MKKNKWSALLIAAAILLGVLTGCGTPDSSLESAATTEPAENPSTAAAETVEVSAEASAEESVQENQSSLESATSEASVEYPISDEIVPVSLVTTVPPYMLDTLPEQDVGNISVFRASEEACGVDLEIRALSFFTYSEELSLLIAAQDLPDIINGLTYAYSSGAVGALEEEICVDVLEYAADYAPDFLKFYQENEQFRKDCTDDEGRVAAVFTAQEENYNISGLLLRADYLEELGLETPTTYDELESVLLAMTNAYDIQYPAFFSGDVQLGPLVNGYGIDSNFYSVDETGNVVYNMITDNFKDYLTMLHRWYEEGLIEMDMLINGTVSPGEMNAYVTDGRAALVSGESDFLSAASRAMSEDENYDIIPISDPTIEKNGTLRVGGDNGSSSIGGDNGWSVNANSDIIPEAMMYINWYWTDAGLLASNFGVEGEGFEYDENGDPVYTDLILNNPDMSFAAAWKTYTSFQVPGVSWYSAVEATFTDESQTECAVAWSKNRSTEGTWYGTLTTDENGIVSRYEADLETLADERVMKFVTGDLNLETDWDTYVADMETQGLATCLKAYQAAYDRYLEK